MKRTAKVGILVFLMACFILGNPVVAYGALPYNTYTYDYKGRSILSPAAYLPAEIIDGERLEVGAFKDPEDMFMAENGDIYILDSGNNRLILFDSDWNVIRCIEKFDNNGKNDSFGNPQGLFVSDQGIIYVADTDKNRIVKLDRDGNFLCEYGPPKSEIIPEDFIYNPTKLAVDKAGRMYVVARTVNNGVMELDSGGNFIGYMGAPRVSPNVWDFFWKRISTREQRRRMEKFVPTEYNNISIDQEGFIYATTSAIDADELLVTINNRVMDGKVSPIKRLNPTGEDVLRRRGYFPPVGDVNMSFIGSFIGPSAIIDVAVWDCGMYSLLDARRGRIFTYDSDGNLLFAFGGIGIQRGIFKTPIALETKEDRIFVLDKALNRITVFDTTEYGRCVIDAVKYHYKGRYEESTAMWKEVLKYNSNADLAYTGIGKTLLRQDEYGLAMKYFKLAFNKSYYAKAFKLYRKEIVKKYFPIIIAAIALIFYGFFRFRRVVKNFYGREVGA